MGGAFTYLYKMFTTYTTIWFNIDVRSFCECHLYFLSFISRECVRAQKPPHGFVVVRVARGANCTASYSTWAWIAAPRRCTYKSTTHRGKKMEFVSYDE